MTHSAENDAPKPYRRVDWAIYFGILGMALVSVTVASGGNLLAGFLASCMATLSATWCVGMERRARAIPPEEGNH